MPFLFIKINYNKSMKDYFKNTENKKNIFVYSCSGIIILLVYCIVTNFEVVKKLLTNFLDILSPFLWGLTIAFLLSKVVSFLENKIFKKLKGKRIISSIIAIALLVVVIVSFILILVPQIFDSIMSLAKVIKNLSADMPEWIDNLIDQFNLKGDIYNQIISASSEMIQKAVSFITESIPNIINATVSTAKGIVNLIIGIICALYMLISKDELLNSVDRLTKALFSEKVYLKLKDIGNMSIKKFYSYLAGAIFDSFLVGVCCFIVMIILGLEYPLLISVVIGFTNIIPYFGPYIGTIPCAFILLIINPIHALYFCIAMLIIQQIDGNIINPMIIGDSLGLASIWVLFAITIGGAYFGIAGMVLGVPFFAVIQCLVSEFIDNKLKEKETK